MVNMKKYKGNLKQSKEEIVFLERVAFTVHRPPALVKLHGGFMHDGSPMDDIKTIAEFMAHSKQALHGELNEK